MITIVSAGYISHNDHSPTEKNQAILNDVRVSTFDPAEAFNVI